MAADWEIAAYLAPTSVFGVEISDCIFPHHCLPVHLLSMAIPFLINMFTALKGSPFNLYHYIMGLVQNYCNCYEEGLEQNYCKRYYALKIVLF